MATVCASGCGTSWYAVREASSQRLARGPCEVEAEGGTIPTRAWFLIPPILTSEVRM